MLYEDLYLSRTKPNISYVVANVSIFIQEPHELHWKETKQILSYIQGTHKLRLHYATSCDHDLVGYIDFEQEGNYIDHKSISSYNFSQVLILFVGQPRRNQQLLYFPQKEKCLRAINTTTKSILHLHMLISCHVFFFLQSQYHIYLREFDSLMMD